MDEKVFAVGMFGYSDDCQNAWVDTSYEEIVQMPESGRWTQGESPNRNDSEYKPLRIIAKTPSGDEVRLYLDLRNEGWGVEAFGFSEAVIEHFIDKRYEEEDE